MTIKFILDNSKWRSEIDTVYLLMEAIFYGTNQVLQELREG
jgi:hypothetical protein